MGKHSQYGVMLDAGSSGTRLYIYKWKDPISAMKQSSTFSDHVLPKLKLHKSKKIHPGVATFANNVDSIGPVHLKSLIDIAVNEIPSSKIPMTPIFLMATAGVRLLPKSEQVSLLRGICIYLQNNTKFRLPDCPAHVQVISGETEGLYGWIATNYLLGSFDHPQHHIHGKGHSTYGFLDMGGASAQIAFVPNTTEREKHANDLKLVRMRRLDGSSVEYQVFTASWLGFGVNKARQRFVELLQEQYGDAVDEIPDPCLPRGLRIKFNGDYPELKDTIQEQILLGTGIFDECLRRTHPLLGKDKMCEDEPCLLNGQHIPAIDFDVNHFVGISEFWHTTHGVFSDKNEVYDIVSYHQKVAAYCSRDWSSIENSLDKRKKASKQKATDAQEACFKASWFINVLYSGIGIPRLGLGDSTDSSINSTRYIIEKTPLKTFTEPFQPVDKIGDIEVSWTLGKMVLYAVGQIPAPESSLPIGFGSNVDSGVPDDFEHAVPSALSPTTGLEDESDDTTLNDPGKSFSGVAVFVLLLVVIWYWLRKPERRRKILKLFGRCGKPGKTRKSATALSFASKLFGSSSQPYERILEEGETAEFELGEIDSDDNDNSGSPEVSKAVRNLRYATPNLAAEASDDGQPLSAMDRHGLVLRTESCERLAPTLQMLNAGRRSRGGSPTRMKSPLMVP